MDASNPLPPWYGVMAVGCRDRIVASLGTEGKGGPHLTGATRLAYAVG